MIPDHVYDESAHAYQDAGRKSHHRHQIAAGAVLAAGFVSLAASLALLWWLRIAPLLQVPAVPFQVF